MAESESIAANHLEFVKSLFQHYSESAFNFYVNKKIAYLLGTPVNTKSAKKTFYHELIQNTSLPTNYNFASIITEIIKKLNITHNKDIQLLMPIKAKENYKHQQIESPTNPSYHYTLGSTINITAIGAFTSHDHTMHISKDLSYNLQHHQDFDLCYHNQILEPQNNRNSDINNQQHLPPVIVINPALPIDKQQQQLLQPPQQPQQQQQLQQPNIDPMAYAPIVKLEKFTGKENNAQVWLSDVEKVIIANGWNNARAMQAIFYFLQDTANSWYQSLANKPEDFAVFKFAFLQYFSNNNSINRLANTFTTIKQGENEAVTTYLRCFHRNLHQIQVIQADYFTAPQILNQFIKGLCSSILQCICPMHPVDLQATVTNAQDFEAAELKANHAQAINLVMNRLSELNSKLKQFSNSINQKLEEYLADNHAIYQPPQ
ncbi:hypothetical protein G9A89_014805 [Geosiphon pyriformis]|nr:hypothetical protein G9A89_014805 [Geosiphon pyriformis]